MKKNSVFLVLLLIGIGVLLTACDTTLDAPLLPPSTEEDPSTSMSELEHDITTDATLPQLGGKIAILTNFTEYYDDLTLYEKAFLQNQLREQYGEERIQIIGWNQGHEQEEIFTKPTIEPYHYTELMQELAADQELKAVIIHDLPLNLPYMEWNNLNYIELAEEAITALQSERDDIFIACVASLQDTTYDTTTIAFKVDLVLQEDHRMMGQAMVEQAQQMGAETLIYYCLDTMLDTPRIAEQLEMVKQCSASSGLELIVRIIPGGFGVNSQQDLVDDIVTSISQYGNDIALFSPVCSFQPYLLIKSIDQRAIYLQPCHPSLYHSYIPGLNVDAPNPNVDYLIANPDYVTEKIAEGIANLSLEGRFGNWPVSCFAANLDVAVAYVDQWMRGEVVQEGVDQSVLQKIMEDYSGVGVQMRPYEKDGLVYENYQLYLLDYITY